MTELNFNSAWPAPQQRLRLSWKSREGVGEFDGQVFLYQGVLEIGLDARLTLAG